MSDDWRKFEGGQAGSEHGQTDASAHVQDTPSPTPIKSGPRLPLKTKWFTMPDEYGTAGFRVYMRTNCSAELVDDALRASAPMPPDFKDLETKARIVEEKAKQNEDFDDRELDDIDRETLERVQEFRRGQEDADERRYTALGKIVLQHNGWCDEDGNAYPPASEVKAFWKAIPDELAGAIMVILRREQGRLPSSMMRGNRR